MRIDAHQHYWDPEAIHYFWMPETPHPILNRKYLPEHLEPVLERNAFDGSILVQAAHDPREARWMLDLADRHKSILGVVAWVDLTNPRLGDELDALQSNPKFKGVRHLVQDEPDLNWLLRPAVINGLKELERRRIPFEMMLRPQYLHTAEPTIDQVPNLPVIFDHIAKPNIAGQVMEGWANHMERLAAIPHVHVKLSGLVTEAKPYAWTVADLRPYVTFTYEKFGPERILFGSDWPVCLMAANSWKEVLAAFTQALGPLEKDVRPLMMGQNAIRFYGLNG